jgi:hypothetical protein
VTQAKKLSFTECVQFVLARLYELDRGDGTYVDVKEISAELKVHVPEFWPFEAVQVLAQQGLVQEAHVTSLEPAVRLTNGSVSRVTPDRGRPTILSLGRRDDAASFVAITAHEARQIAGSRRLRIPEPLARKCPCQAQASEALEPVAPVRLDVLTA